MTASHYSTPSSMERNTILDREVDNKVVLRNAKLMSEALACTVFDLPEEACEGRIFEGSHSPETESIRALGMQMGLKARGTGKDFFTRVFRYWSVILVVETFPSWPWWL